MVPFALPRVNLRSIDNRTFLVSACLCSLVLVICSTVGELLFTLPFLYTALPQATYGAVSPHNETFGVSVVVEQDEIHVYAVHLIFG